MTNESKSAHEILHKLNIELIRYKKTLGDILKFIESQEKFKSDRNMRIIKLMIAECLDAKRD